MTHLQIPEINYSELGTTSRLKANGQRKPASGSIELTQRCNLNCAHCYIRLPRNNKHAEQNELSYHGICRVIDDAAQMGCLWLLMTGGEPLVRSDFTEIYTYAKKKGILVTLFTNGTLITERMADLFNEYSPYRVEISIYGATKETHEKVTMVPGSFHQTMKAIDRLLKRNITLKLKTMAMKTNHHEIKKMQEFSRSLGVPFRFDPIINAPLEGCGSKGALDLRLAPEEVLRLDLEDEKRTENYQEFCQKFCGASQSDYIYDCGAGLNNFHIDPYGQMSICMSARWPGYDLRKGSFIDGFHNFFPNVRLQKPKTSYRCGPCELHSLCGNCPGTAFPETGDPEAVVEYYCKIAHLRAKAFGGEFVDRNSAIR